MGKKANLVEHFLKSLKSQRLWCKPNHKVHTFNGLKQLYYQTIYLPTSEEHCKTDTSPVLITETMWSPLVALSLPQGSSFTRQFQWTIMLVFCRY